MLPLLFNTLILFTSMSNNSPSTCKVRNKAPQIMKITMKDIFPHLFLHSSVHRSPAIDNEKKNSGIPIATGGGGSFRDLSPLCLLLPRFLEPEEVQQRCLLLQQAVEIVLTASFREREATEGGNL